MALLIVLILVFAAAASAASFIRYMNRAQTREGARMLATGALLVAAAGIHGALALLEAPASEHNLPARVWEGGAHDEGLVRGSPEGRFAVALSPADGGAVTVISRGEVGAVTRSVRARVYRASPALLAAVFGAGVVRFEGSPAATVIGPHVAVARDLPWFHVGAQRGIWFSTAGVSIGPEGVRLLLGRAGELKIDGQDRPIDAHDLRLMGLPIETVTRRALPRAPEIDGRYYLGRALRNGSNRGLNRAAGERTRSAQLASKDDSLYTADEFARIVDYLGSFSSPPALAGVVYVAGPVRVAAGQRLAVVDGCLVVEGSLVLGPGASLEVNHAPRFRSLPAVITLRDGHLWVEQGARLRAHGLVYASRTFSAGSDAQVDVVGGLVGVDPGFSVINVGAQMVVRHDPAVLGTPGMLLRARDPAIAWVAEWEELP